MYILGVGGTQNCVHGIYRAKVPRYRVYRGTCFAIVYGFLLPKIFSKVERGHPQRAHQMQVGTYVEVGEFRRVCLFIEIHEINVQPSAKNRNALEFGTCTKSSCLKIEIYETVERKLNLNDGKTRDWYGL